jgi:hypothetical protein
MTAGFGEIAAKTARAAGLLALSMLLALAVPAFDAAHAAPKQRAAGSFVVAQEGSGDGDVDSGDGGDGGDVDGGGEIIDEGSSGDGVDGDAMGAPGVYTLSDAPDPGPPRDIRPGSYTLEARLTADGDALKDGVKWRIFGDQTGSDGRMPLLGEATGGVIYIRLDPGTYFIHASLGRASLARRISVTDPTGGAVFVLNAGGVRLLAMNGKDVPLHPGEVTFDIFAPDEGGSDARYLLIQNAPPGKIIGLTAGIYHVVSRYGTANAVVRADIRVEPGKLTEATMYQKAARLTLKLVEAHGGEALADTAWSVVTPEGDPVLESVGAFPTVILAAGDYKAVATHDGKTFESAFKVEPAINRDVEVLLR